MERSVPKWSVIMISARLGGACCVVVCLFWPIVAINACSLIFFEGNLHGHIGFGYAEGIIMPNFLRIKNILSQEFHDAERKPCGNISMVQVVLTYCRSLYKLAIKVKISIEPSGCVMLMDIRPCLR